MRKTAVFHAAERAFSEQHDLNTGKPKGKFKVKAHTRTVKNKKTGEKILQNVREHERSGSARTIPARPYPGLSAQARGDIPQTIRLKMPNTKAPDA